MRDICLTLLAIMLAACTLPSAQPQSPSSSRILGSPLAQPGSPLVVRRYYLPMLIGAPRCFTTPAAERFATLLANDGRQQRPALRCHPALVKAAQARAAGLVRSDLASHCDVAGNCANSYARAAGCRLPANYGNGNNIESLAAGSPVADAVFAALARSPSHAPHLFGQGDFFRAQADVGIAVAAGGRYGWWWVVLIGSCE